MPVSVETQRIPSNEGPKAPSSSTKVYPSPSSAMNPPAVHARRGKLPKIPKTHRAARVIEPTNTPPTPPASQSSQDSGDLNNSGLLLNDVTGAAVLGQSQHSGSRPRPNVKSSAEILEENDDEFPAEPIEEDMMDLLWKYLTPIPSIEGPHTDTETRAPDLDHDGQATSGIQRKRRAGSMASRAKRPSLDLRRQSGGPSNYSHGNSTSREKQMTSGLPFRTFMNIRSRDNMDPKSTHAGCVAGQPCKNHKGRSRPTPRDPLAIVYHNSLNSTSRVSVEKAEHIFSQCNCYWAWVFTYIWNSWCAENGGIDAQKYSQVELLLTYPDKLREAAWDCCPRGKSSRGQRPRGQHEVVELD